MLVVARAAGGKPGMPDAAARLAPMAHSRTATGWRLAPEHVVDFLVYVVVLNLVEQFAPKVITETFAMSLLVALLLKLVLELVVALKKRALARVGGAPSGAGRAVGVVTLALLLPGSKLLVLWLIDVIFGDAVSLGGFWLVTGLVLVLMASRAGVRWLLAPSVPQTP